MLTGVKLVVTKIMRTLHYRA